MDFEEELPANSIAQRRFSEENEIGTKRNNTEKRTGKYLEYIPITFKELNKLNQGSWDTENFISIYNGKFHFKKCLIYGTVFAKIERKDYFIYIVDDGTDMLKIYVDRHMKDLHTISNLQNEALYIKDFIFAQGSRNIAKILIQLLSEAHGQINSYYNIEIGSKVLVIGKPSYFQETVSINAFSILKDDHKYEIAFKTELIDWYKNNVLPL